MNTSVNRCQALKTLAAGGLRAALAASLGSRALAQITHASHFGSRCDLANTFWIGADLFSFLAEAKRTKATAPAGTVIAPHAHTHEEDLATIQKVTLAAFKTPRCLGHAGRATARAM